MTILTKMIATRLKGSQNTFPLVSMNNKVDMTTLMKLHFDYKDAFLEKHGGKLGLMSGFQDPSHKATSASKPILPPKDRERQVPMARLEKRIATRLKDSHNIFALVSTNNEVDMTNSMKLCPDYKDASTWSLPTRAFCTSLEKPVLIYPKNVKFAVFAEGDVAKEAKAVGEDFVGGDEYIEKISIEKISSCGNCLEINMSIATPEMIPRLEKKREKLQNKGVMPDSIIGSVTDLVTTVKLAKEGKVAYKKKVYGNPKVTITNEMRSNAMQLKQKIRNKIVSNLTKGKFLKLVEDIEKLGHGVGLEVCAQVDGGYKQHIAVLGAFFFTRAGIDVGAFMARTQYVDNNEFEMDALVTVLVLFDLLEEMCGLPFVFDIMSDNENNIKFLKGKPINMTCSLDFIHMVIIGRDIINKPLVNKVKWVNRKLNVVANSLSRSTFYAATQFIPKDRFTKNIQDFAREILEKKNEWNQALEEESTDSEKGQ